MAVLLNQVMPEGVTIQMLDEVTSEMGVDSNPPAGMIVHVHFTENGRTRVVDVWESAAAYDTFVNDRLMPAMQQVAQRNGMTMDTRQPETSLTEVATMVRGKS